MKGLKRYLVKCAKCGYEWMSYKQHPDRCALCNNKNIDLPKVRHHAYEANIDSKPETKLTS